MTAKPAAVTATGRTDVVAVIAGLVTVTLWGSAFVGIRAAGEAFSPGALGLGRLLVSSAILGVVALVRREPVPRGREVLAIAAYGVLWLGVYSVTLNAAERHVDAGTAAMIINTGPILIAVLAGIFLREGFPHRLFAGCAVAFGGCVLIGVAALGSGSRSGLGVALCIVAASRLRGRCRGAETGACTRAAIPGDLDWLRRGYHCLPAVRPCSGDGRCACGRGRDRLDDLSRRCSDRAWLRDLGHRPSANERGPDGVAHLPDSAGGDRARMGGPRRDTAVAGRWRRRFVPGRGRPCPTAECARACRRA